MTLCEGDHLVIKRNGWILTPDAGEAYHEFEVLQVEGPLSFTDDVEYTVKVKLVK